MLSPGLPLILDLFPSPLPAYGGWGGPFVLLNLLERVAPSPVPTHFKSTAVPSPGQPDPDRAKVIPN